MCALSSFFKGNPIYQIDYAFNAIDCILYTLGTTLSRTREQVIDVDASVALVSRYLTQEEGNNGKHFIFIHFKKNQSKSFQENQLCKRNFSEGKKIIVIYHLLLDDFFSRKLLQSKCAFRRFLNNIYLKKLKKKNILRSTFSRKKLIFFSEFNQYIYILKYSYIQAYRYLQE